MDTSPLNGQVAVVTGGTRGIGRAVAIRLAQLGTSQIICNYVQNDGAAEETKCLVTTAGADCHTIRANMAQPDDINRLFDEIASVTGRIDILVHAAAIGAFKPLMTVRPNQWDLSMNVNARAFLQCVQRSRDMMSQGSIVAISSLGSHRAIPNYGAIGVTKGALEAVVRQLAVELGPLGIRVNAVAGGFVDTESIRQFPEFQKIIAHVVASTPVGRIGRTDDIADVVGFLATPSARWIVGQTIIADGGYSLR